MRRVLALCLVIFAGGCCGDPPEWVDLAAVELVDGAGSFNLLEWVIDENTELSFESESEDEGLIAYVEGATLELQAQPGWEGIAFVVLTVFDDCGQSDAINLEVQVGDVGDDDDDDDDDDDTVDPFVDPCGVTFVYEPQGNPTDVAVAGDFNDWATDTHPLEEQQDGTWALYLDKDELPPGLYPYKFVELDGAYEAWTCDPQAGLIHCEEGYKAPDDTSWTQDCTLNGDSCNSLLVVRDHDLPRLVVQELSIDAAAGDVVLDLSFRQGCAGDGPGDYTVELDGDEIDSGDSAPELIVTRDGLAPGRHTLRVTMADNAGRVADEVFVPFWVEERDGWERGVMYYAFIDRFVNGDTSIDTSEGASYELAGYMGGDFQGLIDALAYLDDLGVNIIWISNPQDNAEGPWGGDCGTYSGYHGYWPDDPFAVEEHYGGDAALHALVAEAHGRGMRVVMDWVGNHVHEDHPYYVQHAADWFNEPILCKIGDDYSNFDLIPETCWFAEYLPDIRYYEAAVLDQMVEDAIWWVRTYDLDGFRVDGAKHVPHSVLWNLGTRLNQEVEHRYAGGDQDFYTVGETFTFDRALITAYVNDNELDAQFDFPLYGTLRATFVDDTATFGDLEASMQASRDAYGDALMSTFLGNHDVSRFTSYGDAGGWADSEESACVVAEPIGDAWWYDRLQLAWSYLLTQPGIPLIYYGDEIGMPGYRDPDNRHPLWWYSAAINESTGAFDLDEFADGLYHDAMAPVLWDLSALGQARRDHPAFYSGTETQWWLDTDTMAYARVEGSDQVLVILHRGWWETTLDNGLAFAGLDTDGTYVDILTGETFDASSDFISIFMPGNSARVLVRE
jgi:neopullulanase